MLRLDTDPPHFQPYVRLSALTADFRDAEGWTDPFLKLGRLAVLDAEADAFLAGLEPTDFVSVITRGASAVRPLPSLSLYPSPTDVRRRCRRRR